ncbi:hypothetical protein DFP72DRAFT_1165762 [Ephemerocybe angulata]|uniref:Uncharacterized protein n=1 Tax=Ephemerocybe angulata TaxID=980116 RepID=A0A8H6MD03_9AGAR|nr:hypothetical protein DFP72DRAFT_1165762 [Tulosesus angulatus]
MERCLLIHEVLRSICENLRNPDLLSVALSTKALLGPALNSLWREIYTFKPLVSCLPPEEEIWIVEETPTFLGPPFSDTMKILVRDWNFVGDNGSKRLTALRSLQYPRRAITPADLHRYTSFYAHRIRSFQPCILSSVFPSVEALEALQLATDGKRGALAPLAQSFTWPSLTEFQMVLRDELIIGMSPYMSLFLGEVIDTLVLEVPSLETPVHAGAIELALQRCPRLKNLAINLSINPDVDKRFVERRFSSKAWECLELVEVPFVSATLMRCFAQLPSLKTLHFLHNQGSIDLPHCTPEEMVQRLKTTPFGEDFLVLEELIVYGTTVGGFIGIIQCIPPGTNVIKILQCYCSDGGDISLTKTQQAIDTIVMHCNPRMLTRLEFQDGHRVLEVEDLVEVDLDQELDISSLLVFTKLQELSLNLVAPIRLSPDDIEQIIMSFREIEKLELHRGIYPTFRPPPLVDHTHLIALLQGRTSLKALAMPLDMSKANGEKARGAPFALTKLSVGDSPIYSPSKVVAFLKANCPGVKALRYARGSESGASIFSRRWEVVEYKWKDFMDSSRRL